MSVISQTSQYALQATLVLARGETTVEVGALATVLGVPRNYLSKTLTRLVRTGVLESVRGKHGGFRLARPAESIRLADVIESFEPIDEPRRCLLGRPVCSEAEACAAHQRWRSIRRRITRFFEGTTVADLAQGRNRWPPGVGRDPT